jgi:lipopolysaccharide transport system permease protein
VRTHFSNLLAYLIKEKARPDTTVSVAGATPASAPDDPATLRPLPDEPLIKIRPHKSWAILFDLKEVWAHRELFYFLVWRDLKVRYKQTLLGASWVVLQPLLMTLVFTIFLGQLVRVPSADAPYPLFLYAGLLPWTFFANAVAASSHSLIANAHMVTKVYFPRLIIPAATVAVRLADFLIASVLLIVLMIYYGVPLTRGLLLLPLLVAQLTLLALALGLSFSALNVRYRDIGTMLPVLLQLWMFVSPIIYPSSLVPQRWKAVYELNPLAGIIENLRAALLGLEFNRSALVASTLITLALFVYAAYIFNRLEDAFADLV